MIRYTESRSVLRGGFFCCLLLLGLSACSPSSPALVQTFQAVGKQVFKLDGAAQGKGLTLDPNWQYMSAQINDESPAVFVLGHVDASPQGPTEVWYSAKAQVLRLREGRIVGTQGLDVDWMKIRFEPEPLSWEKIGLEGTVLKRFYDEVPTYRFGVIQNLKIEASAQPSTTRWPVPQELQHLKNLQWFKETVLGDDANLGTTSWYARYTEQGRSVVAYSQQCLAQHSCFRLYRLSSAESRT